MHIEELILEGFKSYATRTVISGWDPEFNAITGLNGTGKSNILDAICFVLGIDNLRQVRAMNLQDLVYKRGQAGITKASVTIVFDNSDAKQSPIGYHDSPKITVTRQQKAVENLFQSVQLNVNNPHFLIMQGRITRVLNMKPPEILAMIEESAGTRMFEDRKSKAINTLDKKEKKVEEITSLLLDTIEPKLNALRAERAEFMEYKRTEAEMERFQRLVAAFDFTKQSNALQQTEMAREEQKAAISEGEEQLRLAKLDLETVADQIMTVQKRKQKELAGSKKLVELEEACRDTGNELVRLQTLIDLKKDSLKTESESLASLEKQAKEENKKMEKISKQVAERAQSQGKNDLEFQSLSDGLKRDEDLLRSLETGLAQDGGKETGFAKLLKEAKDKQAAAKTAISQSEMKIVALKKEIAEMETQVQKAKKESENVLSKVESLKAEIAGIETSMAAASLGDSTKVKYDALMKRKAELSNMVSQIQEEMNHLRGAVMGVQFKYQQPDPSFDASKVKGVVAELVTLTEDKMTYANALEICAGGRLYNVVVEDEKTATALLERGRLTRRVTIIPLNKIQARKIPNDKVSLAANVTKGCARVALSLIGFDGNLKEAMEFVFGNTFICDNKEAANMIAFDKRIGCRAVTIEGDVYEPSGTLSGGSAPQAGSILEKLNRFNQLQSQLGPMDLELKQITQELSALEKSLKSSTSLQHSLKSKQQELSTLERQMSLDVSIQLIARHQELRDQLASLQQYCEQQAVILKQAEMECAQYERESVELNQDRDGKMNRIAAAKAKLAKEESAYKKASSEFSKLQNDLSACEVVCKELSDKRTKANTQLEALQGELQSLNDEYLQFMLDAEMKYLRKFDAELETLQGKKKDLEETIDAIVINQKKLSKILEECEASIKEYQQRIQSLIRLHPWIQENKQSFGVTGSPYDFSQYNMADLRNRLKSLEAQRDALRKTINFNVMDMIDRVEAKDTSLRQMIGTVKKDRSKIEGTITKLNDYMLEALQKTWHKVNKDFGQIMSELLPGSTAKLDLVDGAPITEGLEIKVCLGGVWKESLNELSGGQRSLVALSLILALLQFKPAPMYILDEVDAALDLSHTENIGHLLKTRFKGSQFIVVSLKEGMFANANVLFKTRFKDGVSGVDRTVNREKDVVSKDKTKAATILRKKVPNQSKNEIAVK